MARKAKRNASRGSVNNIILETLYSGEKYGYEIIKEVEEKTDGKIVLKQPSLYSSLSRFESKNYVGSYWSDSEIGGKRHYYYLTDEGRKYYEDKVLNKKSDYDFLNDDYVPQSKSQDIEDDENDSNDIEEYTVDDSESIEESSSYNFNKYNFDVQDRMKELLSDEEDNTIEDDCDVYYSDDTEDDEQEFDCQSPATIDEEIEEQEDYDELLDNFAGDNLSEVEFDNSNDDDILEDKINRIHNAYSVEDNQKPINETIKYTNNLSKEFANVYNSLKSYSNIEEEIDNTEYLREQRKKESLNILYGDQPKENNENKKYKFTGLGNGYYIDKDGITRRILNNEQPKETVKYDNIMKGTNTFNTSDYEEILANSTKKKSIEEETSPMFFEEELSDEDRELKNKRFTEKFNTIADSRMVHSTPEASYEDDLLSLHSLYEEDSEEVLEFGNDTQEEDTFVDFEEENYYFPNKNSIMEEDDNEVEEKEETESNIKVNRYKQKDSIEAANNYIKINRTRFIFGFILMLIMIAEISTMLILLRNSSNYFTDDTGLFVTGYTLTFVIAVGFILPFFLNPNKRKLNTFKLGTSLALGILTFLVFITLTYAVNTFIGFDATNFDYFIAKLLLPIILASNFIVGPVIYKLITLSRRMY